MKSSDSGGYGNPLSVPSLKKYICVKTLFSTTAEMVAAGAIIWKPGFSHLLALFIFGRKVLADPTRYTAFSTRSFYSTVFKSLSCVALAGGLVVMTKNSKTRPLCWISATSLFKSGL